MFQHTRLNSDQNFFQKVKNLDYILLFSILLLSALSLFVMYSTDGGEFLYLLDDEITIGMLIGHFLYQDREVSEFEILHVAVLPLYRNQGFGKKILEELENQLKNTEKSIKIFLEASSINKFAIKLYEKLGYKAYNERKNYYGSNPINPSSLQDAILFAKNLNART